ncbi:PREDICTED: zinc finger protein NUTCRACKER-like [Tarenaya hassleriana]|uniref:zinc finger protein NUTCRACKER-like n=1 Tax=Tarenaya hassleriana TaxID=28532 RepID=UPI00053C84B1|nr:PREDICTED: zinc finger protein NUTCRACKER-like [Tarenaya hassleriana]
MVAEDAISSGFVANPNPHQSLPLAKKKRNLPGNPDPEAEVIALSPNTLMATNRFVCEICGKGFQRDQNLQLHRRGHNLPWKLKQRANKDAAVRKRVYVCPEKACVHHHPSRALGDLTGIKKHFCRKHGDKKYKCEKCSKRYAVPSDWKAHMKTCGTREYRCDCGSVFSRRDSFITHRAFCDALAEETARINAVSQFTGGNYHHLMGTPLMFGPNTTSHNFSSLPKPIDYSLTDETRPASLSLWTAQGQQTQNGIPMANSHANPQAQFHQIGLMNSRSSLINNDHNLISCSSNPQSFDNNYNNLHNLNWVFGSKLSSSSNEEFIFGGNVNNKDATTVGVPSLYSKQHQITTGQAEPAAGNSATALLQKAAQIGATTTDPSFLASFGLRTGNGPCTVLPVQDGNKYYGDMFGSNSMVTSLGSDHDTENSTNEISTLNQLPTQPPAKRRRVEEGEGGGGGEGQTRDFLGVGVEPMSHPWI